MGLDRNEIADQLRDDINQAKYRAGERLPSYRTLAKLFGAATNTVGEAVRMLAGEGLVVIKQNSRAEVRSPSEASVTPEERITIMRNELADIRAELRDFRAQLNSLEKRVSALITKLDH